jgi:hypothetical protein
MGSVIMVSSKISPKNRKGIFTGVIAISHTKPRFDSLLMHDVKAQPFAKNTPKRKSRHGTDAMITVQKKKNASPVFSPELPNGDVGTMQSRGVTFFLDRDIGVFHPT